MKIKRICNILLPVLVLSGILSDTKGMAQNEAGKSVITLGAGYSILGMSASFKANTDDSANTDHFTSNPFLTGSYDIGLGKIFSLGLSYSHQSFRYYYDGYSPSRAENVRYTDKFTRTNYGLRALFHFGKKESTDVYAGVRLGYTVWGTSTNNENIGHKPQDIVPWALRVNYKNTHYTGQAIFGLRYFFNDHIGINGEISVGPPGLFMLGLNGRF